MVENPEERSITPGNVEILVEVEGNQEPILKASSKIDTDGRICVEYPAQSAPQTGLFSFPPPQPIRGNVEDVRWELTEYLREKYPHKIFKINILITGYSRRPYHLRQED